MFLKSKINLLSGLATVLVLGFSSCTEVPVDTTQILNQKVVNQYESNFIAKYGKPAPDQSWDFTERGNVDPDVLVEDPSSYIDPLTRAISSATTELIERETTPEPNDIKLWNLNSVKTLNELAYIRAYEPYLPVKDWTDEYIYGVHDMWVWYVRGFQGMKATDEEGNYIYPDGEATYSLGIHARTLTGGSQNAGTEYFTDLPYGGTASSTGESYGSSNTDVYTQLYNYYQNQGYTGEEIQEMLAASFYGFRIDASGLNDEKYVDVYWYAKVDDGTDVTTMNGDDEFRPKWEMTTFKEYETPYGAVYWLFDCNHDGDYRDLVCLVEPAQAKRYMIEDLGAIYDFDFNDIVVDVVSNKDGQKATVRAMGGTLDFTLTIGNTTWSKSANGFYAATAYNADGDMEGGYQAELAKFEVDGWVPDQNNISITVKRKSGDKSGDGADDFISTSQFPIVGSVPKIIAFHPRQSFYSPVDGTSIVYWMPERVSFPSKYFYVDEE